MAAIITPPRQLAISVVGVYPKPDYLPIPTWYVEGQSDESYMSCDKYDEFMAGLDDDRMADLERTMARAQREVIEAQAKKGIDIITDGEIYRDVYVFHFLRQCDGVDFKNAESTIYRNGACTAVLPVVSGAVTIPDDKVGFMADIWEKCQAMTTTPVKVTLPGPMTITNTSVMRHYKTERESCEAFAECLRQELVSLVQRGCRYIQIDEPLIARKNEAAVDYGIDVLSGLLRALPDDVMSTVHICCGYTDKLDQEGYQKAKPESYAKLSQQLDNMGANAISVEGTFCGDDLSFLSNYEKTTIMLGIISVCKSRVEPPAELAERIHAALKYIPASRLIIAPDCGLGLLPKDILSQKLSNMVQAVRDVRKTLPAE